jgi:hypothetical protein
MAMYQNPQAAMNVLMGGPPTPEEQEIASRILATDGGLPQALENMGAAPPSAQMAQQASPQIPPQTPPQTPLPNQRPTDEETLRSMERMQRLEARSGWVMDNQNVAVPWNPNLTWGVYLSEIFEKQGPEAVDTIIDQQLRAEEPPQEEPPSRMPVLPTLPMPDPNQQLEAAAPPPPAPPPGPPPTAPVGGQGGIMAAANGGLVGFANGGMRDEEYYREQMYDPEPDPASRADVGRADVGRADTGQDDDEPQYRWSSTPGPRPQNMRGPEPGLYSPGTPLYAALQVPKLTDRRIRGMASWVGDRAGGLGDLARRAYDEVQGIRERGALDRQLESTGINLAEAAIYGAPLPPIPPRVRPPSWPQDDQQEEQFFPWWKRINPLTGRYYESDPQLNQGIPKFADGGLNMAPGGSPVGEDEFMNVLSQLSGEAGIPEGQLDAVAEAATQTAGAPAAANDNVMDSGIMQTVEAVEATDEELAGIGSLAEMNAQLVATGEEGLVHATPGELIFDPSRLNEPDQRMLLAALETAGIDPNSATVGNEANILNKMTGLPAFGFFSSITKPFKAIGKGVKKVGKFLKRNAGTILGIAGAMTGNPWLAALGSGIGSLIEGKPIQAALLSAGMSFAGTKWVGPWIGKQLQAAAPSMFSPTVGATIGKVPGVPGTAFGTKVATKTAEGFAQITAQNAAAKAATTAAINAGEGLSREAVTALAQTAASTAITTTAGTGLGAAAIEKGAAQIAQTAVDNVLAGTVTKVAGMAIPERVLTSTLTKGLTQPIGDVIGGQIASYGGRMGAQMLEPMVTGIPAADQQAALDAWNAQYDYTPSSEQLYDFYTNTYVPNQQVDVPQAIGGIPGYGNTLLAAGGGYINGVGGPKSDSNLARLSNGEFVMTEAAVRGAGYGDRIAGARRMYDIMNGLERRAA